MGLTYFDQDTTDLITFSFAVGGYENIAEATSSGLEFEAQYQLTDWLSGTVNYANIDAEDGDGNRLVRVPEHSGNLSLAIDPDGPWSGTVSLRYNGKERDANGIVDSWTRVDLTARYALNSTTEIYGRIENLFDENYQQILGYGTPGTSGYLGVRLGF